MRSVSRTKTGTMFVRQSDERNANNCLATKRKWDLSFSKPHKIGKNNSISIRGFTM